MLSGRLWRPRPKGCQCPAGIASESAITARGVWFAYPSTVENTVGYLASEVFLQFGGRNVIDPNELHEITPDIAAQTNDLDYPKATVTVLSPVRTFWEKATLIHVE